MAELAIELTGVNKYFGEVHANKNISFAVAKGSIHGIIGENGAGKSTLMSILYGYYQADSGSIRLNGQEVRIRNSHDAIARGIGMVHQHFMLVENFTVLENLMLGAEGGALLGKGTDAARAALKKLEEDYELDVDPDAVVDSLSGGERRRVEIARALATSPKFILLDEPFAGVDPISVGDIKQIIYHLKAKGIGVLITDHNVRETLDICETAYIVSDGQLIAEGDSAAILANQTVKEVYLGHEFRL